MKFRKLLIPVISALILVGSLVVTVWGIPSIKDRDIYRKISFFEIRQYKDGIYLTNPGSGMFYNISAFDIYLQNPDGTTSPLMDQQNKIISNEIRSLNKLSKSYYTIKSYLIGSNPTATFMKNKNVLLSLKTQKNNNKVIISATGSKIQELRSDQLFVYVIKLNRNDFILDNDKGVIFSNPEFNGAIKIAKDSPLYSIKTLDMMNKSIELSAKNRAAPSIELQIFSNSKEAAL